MLFCRKLCPAAKAAAAAAGEWLSRRGGGKIVPLICGALLFDKAGGSF